MAGAGLFAQMIVLPVNLVMAWIYWRLVRARWSAQGNGFDCLIVLLAAGSWVLAAVWGFGNRPPGAGPIWPFVLTALGAYVAFTGVLWLGFLSHLLWSRKVD